MRGIIICLLLSGCANLKFEWAASYKTDNLKADIEQSQPAQLAVPVAK